MVGPRCTKGKSCGATCIDARERCNLELGPLVSPALGKASMTLGALFNQGIAAGKERAPSVPPDLKAQLAALGGGQPKQPSKPNEYAKFNTEQLQGKRKAAWALGKDDKVAQIDAELARRGAKAPTMRANSGPAPTGNTKWAREDAGDFDKNFKIYKRIRGDADMINWDESVRKGYKLGEGSYGTVLQVGDKAYKRGLLGANEAEIMRRAGEAGLGPKLLGAEIATKTYTANGTDIHPGRLAMTMVKGRELGDVSPNNRLGKDTAADTYWKALAGLHRMGISHNDAHPHNLMVDDTGKGRWVDFGLARANPKAALNEALGSFVKGAGTSRESGNWQTARWDVTGIPRYQELRRSGLNPKEARIQLEKEHPGLGRVVGNLPAVMSTLKNMGLSTSQISNMMNTEIRSPDSVYQSGPWAKMTDTQAQSLLNTLYDGI